MLKCLCNTFLNLTTYEKYFNEMMGDKAYFLFMLSVCVIIFKIKGLYFCGLYYNNFIFYR